MDLSTYTLPAGRSLVLRTSKADGTSRDGFQWPAGTPDAPAPVEAPDWNPEPTCGRGLHGALRGVGNGSLFSWADDALWQVVEVPMASIVDLGGKIKFPAGRVIYAGDRETATALVQRVYPDAAVIGGTATAGDDGTATAGDWGTATAGDRGTATAGDRGSATAGDRGSATAGDDGTATAGDRGTATAGEYGTLCIRYWGGARYRLAVGYVGEDGIAPGVAYRVDPSGSFVPA